MYLQTDTLQMVTADQYMRGFWWCIYVIAVVVGVEIFAYMWHRYAAHTDYIPGLHQTHQIHHSYSLDAEHEADEDFVWIMLLFILFELAAGVATMLKIIPGPIAITTVAVAGVVFTWNWWIHRSYHQADHWLNNFQWFQTERARHFVHHSNPQANYGIASHFSDWVLGTWMEPLSPIAIQ